MPRDHAPERDDLRHELTLFLFGGFFLSQAWPCSIIEIVLHYDKIAILILLKTWIPRERGKPAFWYLDFRMVVGVEKSSL